MQTRIVPATSSSRLALIAIPLTLSALLLAGCAGGGTVAADGSVKVDNDQGIIHTASADETKYLGSDEPITNNTVILYANGLGCPQCASNIDLQIAKRVPGAQSTFVDLAHGTATIEITPGTKRRLSPKQYHDIVGDAGFTLVKMTSR